MKIFAFIVSLFFMVLTVVPCSDAAKGLGENVCQADELHLEQDMDFHGDFCSPLCVCHCCGMSLTVALIRKLLPEKSALKVKDILPESKYHYEILYTAGIWQPPKIG